ncbi:MAG TPA: alpha-L-rhamnosidase, partial [Saprospiraceae bacterium]|nr:alpha-L-rhamnosidase [Saprospiraceae bacterium]
MKKTIILPLFCFAFLSLSAQDFKVTGLTTEHRTDPVGLDATLPRFSWKTQTERRGWKQSAYQIQASTDADFAAKNLVWDTNKTAGDASVLQTYKGAALRSGTRYWWRVKVWDEKGSESAWSPTAFWET